MTSISKEIGLLAGVSAGSLLVGGLLGYYIHRRRNRTVVEVNRVNKASSEFASELDSYIVKNSLREPGILAELRKYTVENVAMSVMITDPIEGQLFRILLNMLNARKCIEVGTYTGYNALNMALSIPKDGVVYALDVSSEYVSHGRQFFEKANVGEKIDVRIGPAADSMDALIKDGQDGTFDFIFVDADRFGYDTYYEKGLVLLRPGGIIALDNMLQGGAVLNVEELTGNRKLAAEFTNELIHKLLHDKRVEICFLKIADGVTLCQKL